MSINFVEKRDLCKQLKLCLSYLKDRIEPGYLISFQSNGNNYYATTDSIDYLHNIYIKLIGGEKISEYDLKFSRLMINSCDNIKERSIMNRAKL